MTFHNIATIIGRILFQNMEKVPSISTTQKILLPLVSFGVLFLFFFFEKVRGLCLPENSWKR